MPEDCFKIGGEGILGRFAALGDFLPSVEVLIFGVPLRVESVTSGNTVGRDVCSGTRTAGEVVPFGVGVGARCGGAGAGLFVVLVVLVVFIALVVLTLFDVLVGTAAVVVAAAVVGKDPRSGTRAAGEVVPFGGVGDGARCGTGTGLFVVLVVLTVFELAVLALFAAVGGVSVVVAAAVMGFGAIGVIGLVVVLCRPAVNVAFFCSSAF